jgi:hypothetical protein
MGSPVEELEEFGFQKVGEWFLDAGSLKFRLFVDGFLARGILYAFVSGESVLYVGKSSRTLKTRLYEYINTDPSQTTNVKVKKNITRLLTDRHVEIYAWTDDGTFSYRSHPINLAASLEDMLIERVNPAWNRRGRPRPPK